MTPQRLHFTVRLSHLGAGAPWPGSYSALQPKKVGLVHILVTLDDSSGSPVVTAVCSLPRTMLPGDKVEVDCNVPVANSATARIERAPGSYTLRVGLEQVGGAKFSDKGDAVATLPVTLSH
jgi:hypothetical protein